MHTRGVTTSHDLLIDVIAGDKHDRVFVEVDGGIRVLARRDGTWAWTNEFNELAITGPFVVIDQEDSLKLVPVSGNVTLLTGDEAGNVHHAAVREQNERLRGELILVVDKRDDQNVYKFQILHNQARVITTISVHQQVDHGRVRAIESGLRRCIKAVRELQMSNFELERGG